MRAKLVSGLSVLTIALAAAGAVAYAQLTPPPAKPAPLAAPATPLLGSINWNTLNSEQKTALSPLASQWPKLSGDHQRKWIALAHNFNRMSPTERNMLQERMNDWAKLTPAQRTQARLNFGEARKLPVDEKRAKWEEYQTLSAEERERLAADRPKPPRSTAPALRPVPPEKILRTAPRSAEAPIGGAQTPSPLNRNTLLPRSPAQTAPKAAPTVQPAEPSLAQPAARP
ncbi:MAG: DUF3106 domain-containing protein [Comamonadaceae bacterium]|nr:DUF3106 domain-containing protein [Comamonadaceae bacterium]